MVAGGTGSTTCEPSSGETRRQSGSRVVRILSTHASELRDEERDNRLPQRQVYKETREMNTSVLDTFESLV